MAFAERATTLDVCGGCEMTDVNVEAPWSGHWEHSIFSTIGEVWRRPTRIRTAKRVSAARLDGLRPNGLQGADNSTMPRPGWAAGATCRGN